MVFDMSTPGQAKMIMQGYVEDTIAYAGVVGHANSPATDGLFETRSDAVKVPEGQRSWFHSAVAKLAYLAKRARQECLTAVVYLATRVTKCTADDIEKLKRVFKYIATTKERVQTGDTGCVCTAVRRRGIRSTQRWEITHWELCCDRGCWSHILQVEQAEYCDQIQYRSRADRIVRLG